MNFLHRHRGRGHADSLGGQDQRRQRRGRPHHQSHSERVLRHRQGEKPDKYKWLTPVAVGSKQPVGVAEQSLARWSLAFGRSLNGNARLGASVNQVLIFSHQTT